LYYWHQNPTSIVFRFIYLCYYYYYDCLNEKKMFNREKSSEFSFVRRLDMINDRKSAEAKRNNYIRVWVFFSFGKTGRPNFHTCNVSVVKSARYKLRGEQQSRLTVRGYATSVFGKRGEQWDSSASARMHALLQNLCKHTSPRITPKRHAGRWMQFRLISFN